MASKCPAVVLCPDCEPMAGCQHIGCPCLNGNVLYKPASNPPNLPRPSGCLACKTVCDISLFKCPQPTPCCTGKEVNYVVDETTSEDCSSI